MAKQWSCARLVADGDLERALRQGFVACARQQDKRHYSRMSLTLRPSSTAPSSVFTSIGLKEIALSLHPCMTEEPFSLMKTSVPDWLEIEKARSLLTHGNVKLESSGRFRRHRGQWRVLGVGKGNPAHTDIADATARTNTSRIVLLCFSHGFRCGMLFLPIR